ALPRYWCLICFSCKHGGKRLRQPETAGGSLVCATCGQGNRVPWESTIPAPADDPSATPAPVDSSDEDAVPQRRRRAVVVRDPAYCFNHQDVPADQTCNDCGEHFCPACVVVVRGKTLCGPCKNFRLARMQRAPQVSTMAVVSLVLALVGGPLSFCLSMFSRINDAGASLYTVGIGLAA